MTDELRPQDGYSSQSQPVNPELEATRELLPAYALGTTDPDETRMVKEMLTRFPHLIYELEVYQDMRRALTFSAPTVEIPGMAKSRILSGLLEATAPSVAQSAAPVRGSAPTPPPSGGLLDRLWRLLGGSPDTPAMLRLSPALAALAVVLLVASNLYWSGQIQQMREEQTLLIALASQQDTLLTLVGSGQVHRAELAATPDGTGVETVSVVWNPNAEIALLYAQELPPLASNEVYQVWFIRGDQPVSAGLLRVAEDGTGSLLLRSPEPVGNFDIVGITVEPSTGSELPTSAPIAAGELRA
ncbi:MAG: anti-sigma factor [Burkholderiales bacterium]|nr:anti-sigma factor [Anaerolineae bacterium]